MIAEGRVTINGRPAVLGDSVEEGDTVLVGGTAVAPAAEHTVLAFYKPRGVVCTLSRKEKNSLWPFLKEGSYLSYAGRLDKDSEGLLLLTDDGDLSHDLMSGSRGHEKEYEVTVSGELTEEKMEAMRSGMDLPDLERRTLPCRARITGPQEFRIILTQGLNRQIRRMCEQTGLKVTRLLRTRIENIHLGDLKPGRMRKLTQEEYEELRRRVYDGNNG